jgi:hypothetical protein
MEKYLADFNFTIGKTYTINQHGLLEEIKFIITLKVRHSQNVYRRICRQSGRYTRGKRKTRG